MNILSISTINIMMQKKKTNILLAMIAIVVAGTAATTPSHTTTFRNLKVLPQDISEKQLDSIMGTYNTALKVNCDFCHSKEMNTFPMSTPTGRLDFAADNNMKEEARKMMRLTVNINKTYFNQDSIKKADHLLNVVTCNTCHRGNPFPAHE
jgi:uncharacterized membrane protein